MEKRYIKLDFFIVVKFAQLQFGDITTGTASYVFYLKKHRNLKSLKFKKYICGMFSTSLCKNGIQFYCYVLTKLIESAYVVGIIREADHAYSLGSTCIDQLQTLLNILSNLSCLL